VKPWVAPKVDTRSAEDIFEYLVRRMAESPDLAVAKGDPMAAALLRIFSRYCELVIQRLNRVPEKHYLAFLNYLELSRHPPMPARTFLTFSPASRPPGELTPIRVPARTQVAAAPGDGQPEPVVFETARGIELTSLTICKVLTVDPRRDSYRDCSQLATSERAQATSSQPAESLIERELYLGLDTLSNASAISELRLCFELEGRASAGGRPTLEWMIPGNDAPIMLTPAEDTTGLLGQSGEVVFKGLPEWPLSTLRGRQSHWLMCRQAVSQSDAWGESTGPGRLSVHPNIRGVRVSARWEVAGTTAKRALFNHVPLDLSKDFYPFGERPRFGDVLYLSCDAFSQREARVSLRVKLTNPVSAAEEPPIKRVHREGSPKVQWECWSAGQWMALDCDDDTQGFTDDGTVSFRLPASAAVTSINGQEGSWIRARLASGNYGEDARFHITTHKETGRAAEPLQSTLAPPCIHTLSISYTVESGRRAFDAIVTRNSLAYEKIDLRDANSFQCFQPPEHAGDMLYLGLDAPDRDGIAPEGVDFYIRLSEGPGRVFSRDESDRQARGWVWQHWDGHSWTGCTLVSDETGGLSASGSVRLRFEAALFRWRDSSVGPKTGLYWVRALSQELESTGLERIQRVALNTVPAAQVTTLQNELLGASNGTPSQRFKSARAPIVGLVHLEVREPDMPTGADLASVHREEGETAIRVGRSAGAQAQEVWVRWHAVADLGSSGPSARHYRLDRITGEIGFGDGVNGLIPPAGGNNIWLRMYQTGGGMPGNRPPNAITQLRTAAPSVAGVSNLEPSIGGQDVETWSSVSMRGPRWLRHRSRAVTPEDYEDLAREASADVARAKCYGACDLARDASAQGLAPGVVSLIVVPYTGDPKPQPGLQLLRRVREFLDGCKAAPADLVVLAPEFLHVCVQAEIVPEPGLDASELGSACQNALNRYLHPLTGGEHGQGWLFGETPSEAALHTMLATVSGVDYVSSMHVRVVEDRPGLITARTFLVCSGEHRVRVRSPSASTEPLR